jgi:hypothetical protein
MQNLRSSILKALASSLTPPFSKPQAPDTLGLLLALPGLALPLSLAAGVGVGCRSAERLALLEVDTGASEWELRGGLTLMVRLGGVLIAAREDPGGPFVTAPRLGSATW